MTEYNIQDPILLYDIYFSEIIFKDNNWQLLLFVQCIHILSITH